MNYVIVVVGFNKSESISRLFSSLQSLNGIEDVDIVVSLDGGATEEVVNLSKDFSDQQKNCKVLQRDVNLGLKKHMLECFKIGLNYDVLILLEDDLWISEFALNYIDYVINKEDLINSVAGFSLYSHLFNETAYLPFSPIHDGSDCYYMRIPSSWGLFMTNPQVNDFLSFIKNDNCDVGLPPNVDRWSSQSWKKELFKLLISKNKYFLYPRIGLTTNFADAGSHHKGSDLFQVPIQVDSKDYSINQLKDSLAVYDEYCELLPDKIKKLNKKLSSFDFVVDLYGFKSLSGAVADDEYVISPYYCKKAIYSWSGSFKPCDYNIAADLLGDKYYLSKGLKMGRVKKILNRLVLVKRHHNIDFDFSFLSRFLGRV